MCHTRSAEVVLLFDDMVYNPAKRVPVLKWLKSGVDPCVIVNSSSRLGVVSVVSPPRRQVTIVRRTQKHRSDLIGCVPGQPAAYLADEKPCVMVVGGVFHEPVNGLFNSTQEERQPRLNTRRQSIGPPGSPLTYAPLGAKMDVCVLGGTGTVDPLTVGAEDEDPRIGRGVDVFGGGHVLRLLLELDVDAAEVTDSVTTFVAPSARLESQPDRAALRPATTSYSTFYNPPTR